MGKFNFLTGSRVLEEVDSPINGKVTVIQSIAWGNFVSTGNLTQSGGVVTDVWKHTLKKVKGRTGPEANIKSCLILGLGGGSAAKLVKKHWPQAKITGVELDPVMIDLGMKYIGLKGTDVDIKVKDALLFAQEKIKEGKKYDLILIDIYVGDKIPKMFENEDFIKNVKELLNTNGIAVFNRLYYDQKRGEALFFSKKLEKIFSSVTPVYPQANVMFVCGL